MKNILPLGFLLALAMLAIAGPFGLLAWGEDRALLEQRQQQVAALREQQAELQNLVDHLHPDNVDEDLASELVREQLNVAHPDEYVIELEQ